MRGGATGFQGWFALQWPEPVDVAEIVYYGRTGMVMEECFKDYEVYLDDAAKPVARGTFKMTGEMEGLQFEGTGDLPVDVDVQDLNAMLNGGFSFDGTFSATKGGYDLTFNGPDGGGTINSASDGGNLRVAMTPAGLAYDVSQLGV